MNKINLKVILESRFIQFLILTFFIFANIVLISVNTVFIYNDGILFLILSLLIAFYDSSIIIYCIKIRIKSTDNQKD